MAATNKHDGAPKRKFEGKGGSGSKKIKPEKPELSGNAQKREMKKERQSHRRHAEVVAEAKEIWNDLREKKTNKEETAKMTNKLMSLIRGKVPQIALQHDASRVVQAAIQFGDAEQRKELLEEICNSTSESGMGTLPELSKIQYAHFCALKFIKYCARDDECVKMIVKSFRGTMSKIAVHAIAARVVESIFLQFPAKATAPLKQELYGPHFGLFASDLTSQPKKKGAAPVTPTLKSNIDAPSTTEQQAKSAKLFVRDLVTKGMTKSLYSYTYFQNLLAEFVDVCDPSEIREVVISSVADNAVHLISTRAGTRVVAVCVSYATPKDRKRLMKSFKGYTRSSLLHRDAYLAILRIVQVMDDTVSTHKTLLHELLSPPEDQSKSVADIDGVKKVGKEVDVNDSTLIDLALHENGSKLFLLLLGGDETAKDPKDDAGSTVTNRCWKYFDPYERSILEDENPIVVENGKTIQTSKKNPTARRAELLSHLRVSLVELCEKHTLQLLQSLPGARVLKEVYLAGLERQRVCDALLKAASEESAEEVFEHPVAHRSIKNIILCDADGASASPSFSEKLIGKCTEKLVSIATGSNRGAFVVAALLKVDNVKEKVHTTLKPVIAQLNSLGKKKGAGPTAGFEALAKELS